MTWKRRVFDNFRLYAITDLSVPDPSILSKITAAFKNGTDIVQLRAKHLSTTDKMRLGRAIRKIANRMKKLYFVNDSLDLALATDADGLHVGQDDLPPRVVRALCRRFKRTLFLGLSSHSVIQARKAQLEPIDYFAVGPVFSTPTKPDYEAVGLQLVEKVSHFARKPWVVIGGIDKTNVRRVLDSGAERVAVVRAIFQASNPAKASRELFNILQEEDHGQ